MIWIARDRNNKLFLFNEKPFLDPETKTWIIEDYSSDNPKRKNGECFELLTFLFLEVTFENSPKKIKMTIE